jgi:L-asparagine oxygenase
MNKQYKQIYSISQFPTPTGYILFSGFSHQCAEKTPPDNTHNIGETTNLATIQAALIKTMGEMVAYEAEGSGRLFQDIVPNQSQQHQQTSMGSTTELEIHTEQAFSELRPDILSLACLRGDPQALTFILCVSTILEHTTPEEHALLRQPLWKMGIDLSFFKHIAEQEPRGPFPIITGSIEDPLLRFDQDLMVGITQEAEVLKNKIVDIYYRYRTAVNLKAGDILFIDNNRVVHGRSSFSPKYDGNDRFLIRCFAMLNKKYRETAAYRKGRVVLARHS